MELSKYWRSDCALLSLPLRFPNQVLKPLLPLLLVSFLISNPGLLHLLRSLTTHLDYFYALPVDYSPVLHKLSAPTLILSYWTNLVTVSYGTIPYDVLRGQEPSQYVSGRQRKQANEA